VRAESNPALPLNLGGNMIEFESKHYADGTTLTTIHLSRWVVKAALGGIGIVLLALAWIAFGVYASGGVAS
jgi:hypothetical protein